MAGAPSAGHRELTSHTEYPRLESGFSPSRVRSARSPHNRAERLTHAACVVKNTYLHECQYEKFRIRDKTQIY
jgi:hypothetical protein